MSIKTRYTVFNFLKLFLLVSISFLLLFFFIEVIDNVYSIIRHGGIFNIIKVIYKLPSIFVEISPVLTFLSSMFLLGEMIKYGEVRVLEFSGIKPVSILRILFICGFIISGLVFYIKNFPAPLLLQKIEEDNEIDILSFSTDRYLLYSERFTPPSNFVNIQISEIFEDGEIITINAVSAIYIGDNIWSFKKGKLWHFDSNGHLKNSENFTSKIISIMLDPDIILETSRDIDELSYKELRNMMVKLSKLHILPVSLKGTYQERFAYPLLNVFLLLILVPFFFIKQKISRVFVLGFSIFLSFICYGIFSFGLTLAKSGKLPVFLGVWLVHIILSLAVISYFVWLYKKTKSGIM
ncbi:MAG: LptF/LptG family permease [Candidatus Ratteibacteria bacterium]|nr:LptF/LptG family permease [Candidatus Ratteibacteria bacterium]